MRVFQTSQEALEERAFATLPLRYLPDARPAAQARLQQELATVRTLEMAGFFLTAAEVTDYCREHGILAAGRGSAAGSVLCYLLGITLSDPIKHNLLFERFLHTGRASMPDVDIDIASSRRDQVLSLGGSRAGAVRAPGKRWWRTRSPTACPAPFRIWAAPWACRPSCGTD